MIANKPLTILFTFFIGVMAFAVLGMGCGGGSKQAAQEDETVKDKLEITTEKTILLTKIGYTSSPGGYYALTRVNLANKTKSELSVTLTDFSLKEKKQAKEPDAYSVPPEAIPGYVYTEEFGRGTEQNVLVGTVAVKPGFEFSKDLFFNLPNSADITDYELFYAPDELKFDMEDSLLDDRRS